MLQRPLRSRRQQRGKRDDNRCPKNISQLAGAVYAHYQSFINPEIFGIAQSLDAILAVIIGGSGTIAGPIVGAFFVVFLPEYLRFADSFRLILYGLVLVLATIFMPRGIAGVSKDLFAKLRNRRT